MVSIVGTIQTILPLPSIVLSVVERSRSPSQPLLKVLLLPLLLLLPPLLLVLDAVDDEEDDDIVQAMKGYIRVWGIFTAIFSRLLH